MAFFLIQFLTGLANAMVLFLVGSGLSLIFGVTRIINFGHGAFYMLGAYLAATFAARLPLPQGAFFAGALLAALAVAALGGLVEVGLLRRIYRAPELHQLLLTFALVLVIGDAVRFFWGTENRTGPTPPSLAGSVPILGQLFPVYDLAMLALGPAVALALWGFARTRWGILVRAASQDREMLSALGVNQATLFTGVFVLGSFLAGLAGALQVPRQALSISMDSTLLAEAFVVVVIGGLGSTVGAFLGAVLIGLLQAFGILWLPRGVQLPLVFVIMAAVLVLRPWGLLGRPEGPPPLSDAAGAAEPFRLPRWLRIGGALLLLLVPPLLPTFALWLLTEILAFALFAGSLQLLLGTAGLISFGHAAYFGLGAYGAALWMTRAGGGLPGAFLAAILLAGLGALLVGCFAIRLRGVYLAMLTLAGAQIAQAVLHEWYAVTGGDNGILGVWPRGPVATPLGYYYLALALAGAGLWVLGRITGSPFGLLLRAARDHRVRAEAIGITVSAQQLLAFTVAGLVAGLGGALFAFLNGSVFPDYLGIAVSVEGLVMVLLGGLQSLAGAPVGAALYTLLDTAATRYTDYWQAVLGGILILLVLAFPRGVWRRPTREGRNG